MGKFFDIFVDIYLLGADAIFLKLKLNGTETLCAQFTWTYRNFKKTE